MMVGQGFGAYARAISRDRWRLYKVEERLREVNIGGTAIGTGMNAPLKYIYMMTDTLQELTGIGIARSEYPMDTTQNMDVFVEVSGLLKSASTNLIKIANDLRLLSSGPYGGIGEIHLPPVQAGSSLSASSGLLELNAFAPIIAESFLESLEIMTKAVNIMEEKCIRGISVDQDRCTENLNKSSAIVTALVNHIGYDKATQIAKKAVKQTKTIRQIVLEEKILPEGDVE